MNSRVAAAVASPNASRTEADAIVEAEVRAAGLVDRVHLDDDDLVLEHQLVERVRVAAHEAGDHLDRYAFQVGRKKRGALPLAQLRLHGLPQRGHRLYFRTANFGVRFDLAMIDFLANVCSPLLLMP